MTLPIATTTIAVKRDTSDLSTVDPYEASAALETVAEGVRAVIGSPSGREAVRGGAQEVTADRLDCDPTDLRHTDVVVDESTGATYQVVWVRTREGLGLDHVEAGVTRVDGHV